MGLSLGFGLGLVNGRGGVGKAANWADAWTLGTGQKPAAVVDFVNAQYFDGTNNKATLSTLVQNATVDAGGLITNAGNINVLGNFLTALKNAGGATVVAEISGGNNTAAYGILSMSSGGPDSLMIANGPNTGGTMDSYNGTSIPGPVTGVDFTKTATFASSWNNAGAINDATAGVVGTAAKNFSTITAAQLGSYAGASLWPGRIRSIAIYTGTLATNYLKNMSWPGPWNKPFNGSTGLSIGGGQVLCGQNLSNYFNNATPWSMVADGMASGIGNLMVLFTNVVSAGAPPWYGHECIINTNGKMRVSIFGGWAGGAATTHLIQVEGSTVITAGPWNTYGATYDGSGLASGVKVYVNGVPETTSVTFDNLDAASNTNVGQFELAGQFGQFQFPFMDFFSLSKIARPASYFAGLRATRTRPAIDSNTLAYYDFTEGTGATTADKSGNGNTGTLSGGAAFI